MNGSIELHRHCGWPCRAYMMIYTHCQVYLYIYIQIYCRCDPPDSANFLSSLNKLDQTAPLTWSTPPSFLLLFLLLLFFLSFIIFFFHTANVVFIEAFQVYVVGSCSTKLKIVDPIYYSCNRSWLNGEDECYITIDVRLLEDAVFDIMLLKGWIQVRNWKRIIDCWIKLLDNSDGWKLE